jgi:plasmid replication initiation protein
MARRSPQTHAKRQRELAKADKRREKAEKRALRKALKSQDSEVDSEDALSEAVEPEDREPQPS